MGRWIFRVIVLLVLVGAAIGAVRWYTNRSAAPAVSLRTVEIKRDDLISTISATGTLEPEEVVDVGAQVAGQILTFGKDDDGKSIDYGSKVSESALLATIDDSTYKADVQSANATLEQAKAGVTRAEADLVTAQAKLAQAQADWQRAEKLGPGQALAQQAIDQYKAAYDTARASIAVADAGIAQAKSSVSQAEASLWRAQRNLGYCTIKSPVKGVVIDRRVNIGQTVVASLNAPSLFLIARDLRRMQVWVSVNEADIGNIHNGQAVTFTVDAFQGRTFTGEVRKVRLNAQMTQNVVTYTVEITTANDEEILLPYLTANVQFQVQKREDVLMVPNAALRYQPSSPALIVGGAENAPQSTSRPAGGRRSTTNPAGERERSGTIWVVENDKVKPVKVRIGITDGVNTEVMSKDLTDSQQIAIGEQTAAEKSGLEDTKNPFMPQMGRRPGGGGGRGGECQRELISQM